jgi:hypothetical protein
MEKMIRKKTQNDAVGQILSDSVKIGFFFFFFRARGPGGGGQPTFASVSWGESNKIPLNGLLQRKTGIETLQFL